MNNQVPEIGGWTTVRYWTFIRSLLRKGWNKYPCKYQALKKARRSSERIENKRIKWEYKCAECEKWYLMKEVCVDHIVSCGTLKNYYDLSRFCQRLFCGVKDLQILCKYCHDIKSYMERCDISWLEAAKRKDILNFLKQTAKLQQEFLLKHGFKEEHITNQIKRKRCYSIHVQRKK